jgi:hypothetical protein
MEKKLTILMALFMLMFGAQAAVAECFIGGTITASSNPDPQGPTWMYTMTFTWDTGNTYSLSHANLLMDIYGGTCLCQDFVDALSWEDPIGSSDGVPDDCQVDYQGFLECDGDPSIPGEEGIILKFEPIEGNCEPGPTGTATFVFYSDLPPTPINEEILSAVDKNANEYCFGFLTGDFPAMECDPVGNEGSSWGNLKGLFR